MYLGKKFDTRKHEAVWGIVKFQKVKFQSEVLPNCHSSYHHWMSLEADAG